MSWEDADQQDVEDFLDICDYCEEELDPSDTLAMDTGFCSEECHDRWYEEMEEEEEDFDQEIERRW